MSIDNLLGWLRFRGPFRPTLGPWLRRRVYRHAVISEERNLLAIGMAVQRGHLVVQTKGGRPIWLHALCPCRCGEILRVNLMPSAKPSWAVSIERSGGVSVTPSLDVRVCGSHFWIKGGHVEWVEWLTERSVPRQD